MSTIAVRTRKSLVAGLAGVALAAGLGLGGAGVAHADSGPQRLCLTNIHGTATLSGVPGRPTEHNIINNPNRYCVLQGNTGPWLILEDMHWKDPEGVGNQYTSASNALSFNGPDAAGNAKMDLHGEVTGGYMHPTKLNQVSIPVKNSKGFYEMDIRTTDKDGVRLETQLFFNTANI